MLRQYRDLLRNSAREDNDMTTQTIEMDSYRPRDGYFGKPYIDRDEYREKPWPHRNVHGGFENTDTRFTFYFPAEEAWGEIGRASCWDRVCQNVWISGVGVT